MAVQVETFELVEIDNVTGQVECDAEALALIESLGLTGQQKLLGKKDDGEVVRCPYRLLSLNEMFVYSTLLPTITKLHNYESGCIPLRVLQVAAHAKDLFKCLYVWHTADKRDPLLTGANVSYPSTSDHFLLARWDDVLEPFSVLEARAVKQFREAYKSKMLQIQAEVVAAIATIGSAADSVIAAGEVTMPTFYK